MPIANIARFRSGQQTVNRAPADGKILGSSAKQDYNAPVGKRDSEIDRAADNLSDHDEFLAVRQEQLTLIDFYIISRREGNITSQFARLFAFGL